MTLQQSENFDDRQTIVIKTMFLGEEGVGKSTFINNLMGYDDELKQSKSGRFLVLDWVKVGLLDTYLIQGGVGGFKMGMSATL